MIMMKTVTISNLPTTSLLFGSFSNTLPHFTFYRRNSLSFHRNSALFYPRTQSKRHKMIQKECPGDIRVSLCSGGGYCKSARLVNVLNEFDAAHLPSSIPNTDNESNTTTGISTLVMYESARGTFMEQLLKFVFLFGSLSVLSSAEASAASNFADNLQSGNFLGDLNDISTGFASAFLLIFFSEIGDKTFFIAALLAARNSAAVVFAGTFGALGIMTVISVVLGRTFHYIDEVLPFSFAGTDLPIDDIAAVCLLVYFGVTTLIDATSSDSQKAEDEQKEAELAVSDFSGNGAGIAAAASTVISTFALVFVAEWGDKSFFSTIALAAASSPLGVIGGALAGHGAATLLAVAGGSLLGTFLSEKVIAYTGGVLFLVFAGITLVEIITG